MKIAVVGEGHLAAATRTGCDLYFEKAISFADADLVWFCVDTPVDEHDRPDVEYVFGKLSLTLRDVQRGTPVLISSQLPVGTHAKWSAAYPEHCLLVQPENIRRAYAVEDFLHQSRMIVGHKPDGKQRCTYSIPIEVLHKFTTEIIWMSPESAEMAKHTLNAYLAMCIAFANEIADICELVGADPQDVIEGLRSDKRVGYGAPLIPGDPYTGGTLGRDVRVLLEWGNGSPMILGIHKSNEEHLTPWPKDLSR